MNQGRAFGALQPQRPPSSSGQRSYSRQIATLGFVSEELPSTLLSRQLAAALFAESKQQTPVVLVRFQKASLESSDEQKAAIPELYLNGEFHLPAELVPTPGGFPTVTITI